MYIAAPVDLSKHHITKISQMMEDFIRSSSERSETPIGVHIRTRINPFSQHLLPIHEDQHITPKQRRGEGLITIKITTCYVLCA